MDQNQNRSNYDTKMVSRPYRTKSLVWSTILCWWKLCPYNTESSRHILGLLTITKSKFKLCRTFRQNQFPLNSMWHCNKYYIKCWQTYLFSRIMYTPPFLLGQIYLIYYIYLLLNPSQPEKYQEQNSTNFFLILLWWINYHKC